MLLLMTTFIVSLFGCQALIQEIRQSLKYVIPLKLCRIDMHTKQPPPQLQLQTIPNKIQCERFLASFMFRFTPVHDQQMMLGPIRIEDPNSPFMNNPISKIKFL